MRIADGAHVTTGRVFAGMGKKGHESKKWKPLFFVLNGEKQYLYYFEHSKKTKPKGLIDLSYGAVYPVDESYFGR